MNTASNGKYSAVTCNCKTPVPYIVPLVNSFKKYVVILLSGKPKVDTPELEKIAPVVEVDGSHPEVIALVEAAVKEAEKQEIQLPADVYVEIMEEAIKGVEKEIRRIQPNGPM